MTKQTSEATVTGAGTCPKGHATTRRGHLIGPWTIGDHRVSTSACLWCSRTVTVNTRPMPNEINIGGAAVAINCEGRPVRREGGVA